MADSPITEGIIERLMTGVDTEDIYIGDVSDVQLYGQQYLRRLSGHPARAPGQ